MKKQELNNLNDRIKRLSEAKDCQNTLLQIKLNGEEVFRLENQKLKRNLEEKEVIQNKQQNNM